MKFKIDENLPTEIAEILCKIGHDALTVFDEDLEGEPDADIVSVCQKEKRALLTLDTDFANIRSYPPKNHPGIVVFRLKRQDKPYLLNFFRQIIKFFSTEQLNRYLWIVEEDRIRIRD